MFLKDRMLAVQVDREAIESVLQGDLKEARDTIGIHSVFVIITSLWYDFESEAGGVFYLHT